MTDIAFKRPDPITNARKLSIAPMMDWTDRFDRYFLRLLSRNMLLYTEMVTTGALLHGDVERHLEFDTAEHPVACQLGGHNPDDLAHAAKLVKKYGYDEVNLNVGCPSDRVQNGRFGACLMAEPDTVADAVKSMQDAVDLPVTIKHRIGIDDNDHYDYMRNFVETVTKAGCEHFIVHARVAILQGLSPKENRDIPPLKYDFAYRLKQEFPELHISINGGIQTIEDSLEHLNHVDGVMIGRAAYNNPYMLVEADHKIFGEPADIPSRHDVLRQMYPYVEKELSRGTPLIQITRHLLGVFAGIPGGRKYRRHLSENAYKKESGLEVLETALGFVSEEAAARHPAA
ncbi:tRNA dihydrouridine(20/20a) synthase DusA [Curvivirga aplysinae]|uniref:tRNA dihydrouridine(20/20a) synthase DusA n=1 Tax=Curvivirga aplysinae TaxID=2529852 RepID=UPI0012BD11E0|nr:tRNA dihydrouridine(20/20a) synthase DusA [Curvivirga aplysinae]